MTHHLTFAEMAYHAPLAPEQRRLPQTTQTRLRMRYLYPDELCSYCGCRLSKESFSIDHVEPRARYLWQGKRRRLRPTRRGWDNLVPACRRCNTLKDSMRLLVWLLSPQYRQRVWERRPKGT